MNIHTQLPEDAAPRPSRTRQLLALYVDYLVFTAVYVPVRWLMIQSTPTDHWWVSVAIFLALRGVAAALRLVSPGQWALGIHPRGARHLQFIRGRERWWTIAAGVLLVLEGSKNAVRWTQGLPVEPLLGGGTPQSTAVVAMTLLGALNILAGFLILRTHVAGAALGAGVLLAELFAAVLHREAFRRWAAEAVAARRALHGVPVRDGEIEFMQVVSTVVLPAAIAVGLIWLSAIAARFVRAGAQRPAP